MSAPSRLSRRAVLGGAIAAVGAPLAGCSSGRTPAAHSPTGAGPTVTSPPTAAGSPTATGAVPAVRHNRPGPDITHGSPTSGQVALTFHGAGDPSLVQRMLSVTSAAHARVTVLAIGQWLADHPDLARRIIDGGHQLGNHTWSHQTMPRLDAQQTRVEIERAAAELVRLTGSQGTWFRPSGTPHSTARIRAASTASGYGACLGYDLDPLDYTDPGPGAILRRVAGGVRSGSIVSLHLGHPGTMAAMPALLRLLDQRGLAPVTASELLGLT